MDARPFRGRGAENIVAPLHQRHKSTGNLASMASTTTTGFRGPAKRAAFGDVTNLTKNTGGARDEAKAIKIQAPVVSSLVQPLSAVGKENALYTKDSLSRPAQRSATLASKPRVPTESRPAEAVTHLTHIAAQNPVEHLYNTELPAPREQVTSGEDIDTNYPSIHEPVDIVPLQPRHHKSQPQLKVQQPTLRRTQSKQLEKIDLTLDDIDFANVDDTGVEGLPSQHSYPPTAEPKHHDLPYLPTDLHTHVDVNRNEAYVELHEKLPDISEEPAPAPLSYRRSSAAALSEPEECWDEDDEDYDDQDQAYTTAHSFRSRDMTTGGATTMVAPRVTARVQRELEEARQEVQHTRCVEDIEEEMWDVSMVIEYGEEIFEYMRELEIRMLPNPHYMETQTDIQWSMRSVLMDWLVQVHNRFSLLPETLFLTVNYIDRFLSCKIVSMGKLQLVGATAILVASKYEEINCPSLEEIVYMVDGGYTTEEVLKAERFMLSMLSFELGWPGPMSFLRRVSKADDYDLETRTLAKYFLELTIMDERFVASPPSFLAAGAHCLSRLILKKGDWTKAHVHYSGYTWTQLKPLVSMMIECCEYPNQHHGAIFEKYRERRFKEASIVVQEALDAGFALPHHPGPIRPMRALPAHPDNSAGQLHYLNGLLVSTEG